MRGIACVACAVALLAGPASALEPPREPVLKSMPDLGRVAQDLAGKLGAELVKRGPKDRSEKFRVAVFPFGNSEGRYPLELGDNGPVLRGALVDALRAYLDKNAPGKFVVLYPEQVDEEIRSGSTDPRGISGKNLVLARKLLKALDLQVAVVGRFEVRGLADLFKTVKSREGDLDLPRDVRIEATAVLPTTSFGATSAVNPGDVGLLGLRAQARTSGRLGVRFFVKVDDGKRDDDPTAWKHVPLHATTDRKRPGPLYLIVPRAYQGKRYKVVLLNRGKPALFRGNRQDPDRVFSACVLIDGVSTFMRPEGKQYRHLSGHPASLPKWLLTPVGKQLVPDRAGIKDRMKGARLDSVRGAGGSAVHVPGFQKGREKAGSFVFARAVDSVAAPELLSLRKIGTISVYFYAEDLPGDVTVPDAEAGAGDGDSMEEAGTKMGKDVRSRTFSVQILNWYPEPREVWRILYRYEGHPSIPRNLRRLP